MHFHAPCVFIMQHCNCSNKFHKNIKNIHTMWYKAILKIKFPEYPNMKLRAENLQVLGHIVINYRYYYYKNNYVFLISVKICGA